MSSVPTASVLVPTRNRPDYLEVALASLAPQVRAAGAELIVIDDGYTAAVTDLARRHDARLVPVPAPGGINLARNAGLAAARGDLLIFVDDDVRADPGWLDAYLEGAASASGHDAFGGPIRVVLEGGGPRSCGREGPPITSLDLGCADRDAPLVWGANMALRRRAVEAVGPFHPALSGPGDEQEWEERYRAQGGRIRYLAAAGLEHRRTARDATLSRLARAAYRQGRGARRFDARRDRAPTLRAELRKLAGCAVHATRFRCPNMVVIGVHAAGRVAETLTPLPIDTGPPPGGDDFVSRESGEISGIRATTRALATDGIADALALVRRDRSRLRAAARALPRRRVLVLAIERPDVPSLLAGARAELARSHHEVRFVTKQVDGAGKFENLDTLLERVPAAGHDWLLVIDDDVALPRDFLDMFLFLAERFDLSLAQPAHRARSHAAWQVTRRRPGLVAHETRFVEIGPVTAFHARTFETLLPFPPLRFGWGLELHWSALARARGWREGVIDAVPVGHALRRVASAYSHDDALAETRAFLAARDYLPAHEVREAVSEHRSWR